MAILTVIATCLGIFLSVLNLVVFLKEKDRSHVRSATVIVTLGALLIGLAMLPRYAPDLARGVAQKLPNHQWIQVWLAQAEPESPPLEGSFIPEVQHNLFGGISGLKLIFHFASTGQVRSRVLSYRLQVQVEEGQEALTFERVLSEPIVVDPDSTARSEVEVDGEILDAFLKRMDAEHPGRVTVSWHAADERGVSSSFSAIAGKF